MKFKGKANLVLLILSIVIFVVICVLAVYCVWSRNMLTSAANMGWGAKKQLDFAETLANKGLKKEALAAFDDYLKAAKLSAIEAAKLLYRMGNMYMDLLDYERALYYFYKAEAADPNAGFKTQLDEKLVECLENLGMTAQETGGVVFAKVGDEEITELEINDAINAIPDWARGNFTSGEGKVELVRQYATTQALYKKAKRMGLEQDAEVKRNLREVTKQLLVQKFLESQLKNKITVQPTDIEIYYEANKDKYKQQATAQISVIKISDQKKAQDIMRRLNVGADFAKMARESSEDQTTREKGGMIEGAIEKNSDVTSIGISKEAMDAIFLKKEGEVSDPIQINDVYYIFKINKATPERQKFFEEAREQVEYEYRNKKVQEQMQALLKDILQEEQVEIYTDRILGKDEAKKETKQE